MIKKKNPSLSKKKEKEIREKLNNIKLFNINKL